MKKYQFDDKEKAILEELRVPLAVYQFVDKKVVTLALSAGFVELLGFSDKADAYQLMDHDMYRDTHPDDKARIANAAFRFATEGGRYEVIYRSRQPDSKEYRVLHAAGEHVTTKTGVRLAYIWYTDEGAYAADAVGNLPEINTSFSKALHEESLLQASHFDLLTGLPNMSYFFDLAEEFRTHVRESGDSTPALVFADLSGMKYFNRKYGLEEGDKLLRAFADIIKRHFGNESCSRFGSDHFCIYTVTDGLEDTLRAIFAEFSKANDGKTLPIRVGIYCDNSEGTPVAVSTGCDRAKHACDTMRNTYVSRFRYFNDTMLAQEDEKHYIINNFERALEEKWIQVYYQPIIHSANGMVSDEEALARWNDPVMGKISPGVFIPVLEEARLIDKLDMYVCEQVLNKMKDQKNAGLYVVPESINLSRIDFDTCDIVEEIRRRVDDAGIDRGKLTIELTESVLATDLKYIKSQIERFCRLGFRVWMDDFGSGYSSLDVLQTIRFDTIKLDMRFLKTFNKGSKSKIILTELIKMAIALGIDTVCEGVETKEQADFLREVGCTKLQGFYYCSPIPFDKIVERYEKGVQIGFENPDESEYYAAIGRVNLYDLASIANEQKSFRNYFNTVPMAVYESCGNEFYLMRCNNTYRTLMQKLLGRIPLEEHYSFIDNKQGFPDAFVFALEDCALNGTQPVVDEVLPDGTLAHAILKRIAVNPVTDTKAVAVAVLTNSD